MPTVTAESFGSVAKRVFEQISEDALETRSVARDLPIARDV